MHKFSVVVLSLALLASSANAARSVKVIEPLAAGVAGSVRVVSTAVTIGDTARPIADKLEAKAADKRAAAKLPAMDAAATPASRPEPTVYET